MAFGLKLKGKSNKNAEKAAEMESKAAVSEAAEENSEAAENAEEGAVKPVNTVPAANFSSRIAGIFGRMYTMILSVSLANNVVQVESGELRILDKDIPLRMYYTDWCQILLDRIHPVDKDDFIKEFNAKALSEALSSPGKSFTGTYTFAEPEVLEKEDGECSIFELRADAIPSPGEALNTRCIIFVKEVEKKPIRKVKGKKSDEELKQFMDWNNVRMSKLFGGSSPMFFEYDTVNDRMQYHYGKEDEEVKVLENYIKNIETRSDWTIFHSDVNELRNGLALAKEGRIAEGKIRYRADGGKGKKFHIHKFAMAPMDETVPAKWVVGILTDVDAEEKTLASKKEISAQISELISDSYEGIYEINLDKDLIFKITKDADGSFVKSETAAKYSDFIKKVTTGSVVKDEYKSVYKDLSSKSFLERKTLAGNYDVDVQLRLPGHMDYEWYQETICKLEGVSRYLRFLRNTNEIQSVRQKETDMAEALRYMQYNDQMLSTMASLVEFRNVEAGPHIDHVCSLTSMLLEEVMRIYPDYNITKAGIRLYGRAATMHDIGKITVPDSILNKPGKLDEEEWKVMMSHTVNGAKIIEGLSLPGQHDLVDCCRDVALHHHERYDGKGYPEGLVGDANNIYVQAVGLADVYDALVSVRCYKGGLSHDDADRMIMEGECGAFNPKLMECFSRISTKMRALYIEED